MDALILSLWARETHDAIVGARITEAGLFGPWRAALRLDSESWLTLSIDRSYPSLFLDERPRRKPTGGLPGEMEQLLLDARITALDPTPGERIVRMTTERGSLVLELVPSAPALVAIDAGTRVVALIANARRRPERLAVGATYTPPTPPDDVRFPGLERASREALARLPSAGGPVTRDDWITLVHTAATRCIPTIVARGDGFRATATASAAAARARSDDTREAATVSSPGASTAGTDTWNAAVRRAFIDTLRAAREARAARAFAERLKTLERRVTRSLAANENDLERARDWHTWERYGSTLMAHAHLVKRGDTLVKLPDVFDPDGPELVIPVDPRVGASANAAAYMKRSKRGRRSIDMITERRDGLRSDLDWITERRTLPIGGWSDADRAQLEKLLVKHRVRAPRTSEPYRQQDPRAGERFHPKRFRTTDGWLILVGRNNEENDYLSLKIAKQEDIWLHAHGVPGSHVVMKREGQKDNPSKQALEEAAAIAALHSKARHAGTVPVVYTRAKYVRKPRKAKAGTVTCEREKTIMVRPADPNALATDDAIE